MLVTGVDISSIDLDWAVIDRELARAREKRRSGPIAENILQGLGLVGGKLA